MAAGWQGWLLTDVAVRWLGCKAGLTGRLGREAPHPGGGRMTGLTGTTTKWGPDKQESACHEPSWDAGEFTHQDEVKRMSLVP